LRAFAGGGCGPPACGRRFENDMAPCGGDGCGPPSYEPVFYCGWQSAARVAEAAM